MDIPETPHEPNFTGNRDDPDNEGSLQFGKTDDELRKELQAYAAALREEFANPDSPSPTAGLTSPTDNVEKYTRQFFRQNLPDAAAQVVWLSSNSDSDSVRLRACQIIINHALEDAKSEGDPIKDILKDLQLVPTTDDTTPNN